MKTICITLVTILFLAFLIARFNVATEPQTQILADVGSEIEVVVCSATSARTSSLRNAELVANIVNGLPNDVQVLLLVNDRESFHTNSGNNRVKFIELAKETGISIWPQDPFVVVSSSNQTKLITPCIFDREDDHVMPIALAKALDIEIVQSELHFEGGNIVCGEEDVLIGFNTISLNAELLEETASKIVSRFQKLFGRPVMVVGNQPQEINHIDLVITPLPGKRVAIADSRLGAAIAQKTLQTSREEMTRFEQACENNFFGREDITNLSDLSGNSINRPQILGQTQQNIQSSIVAADQLDAMARQFTDAGYQVIRIPALVPDLTPKRNESGKEMPNYPFITYNNVLVENRHGTPTVYLPQYDFPALDSAGVERWAESGFQVTTIPGFTTSAMYGGALRCCTKVLLRKSSSK